ncbi:insulinase family protein [bacterium]|nr:insulinase family protein [bacterium]
MKHETYEIPLKNGGRLVVIHVPGSPIFHLETHVNSGHRFAKKSQYELPHLLEHLALEGSKRFPDPRTIRFELEKYGIYHNAFTSLDRNWYEFYGAKEYMTHIVDLAYEWLLEPTFTEEAIAQQKQVVENELTQRDANVEQRLGYAMYQATKNGLVPSWKQRIKSMSTISRQDILDYHATYYRPSNLTHMITGDLPKSQVTVIQQQIEDKLAGMPSGKRQTMTPVIPTSPKAMTIAVDHPEKSAVQFDLSFVLPGFDAEFDKQHFTSLRIFQTIQAAGLYARLFEKTRAAGLTYTIGMEIGANQEFSFLDIYDKVKPENMQPLLELVFAEMRAVAAGGFTDEELERAIGFRVGKMALRFQTALNFTSWYEDAYIYGMPLYSPDDVLRELQAVTRDSVVEAVRRFFTAGELQRRLGVASAAKLDPAVEQLVRDFKI